MGTAAASVTSATTAAAPAGSVAPNATNELDCNGWSKSYKTVKKLAGDLCTDPIKVVDGKGNRFVDNGWYVGHDEPSVKFISTTPGSGNTMTYLMKVPTDPKAAPTATGSVTNYGQLSVAPWFGLPICDPNSYPQNPCTPDSDTNSGSISNPAGAGSAFMELQLYPPGYTPFVDSESCSVTKWCAALTIDSLECTFGFATCNANCEEPVNFAFLQNNGVPAGPPSPQLADVSTFLPNSHTLLINAGDVLQISVTDPPQGFTTTIRDLTTHQTGWMTASAGNGFMNTNIADCSGTPFTFHAEYSTASVQNRVPWAALEGGVLMEQEIGHSEVCNSVKHKDPFSESFANGQSYTDNDTYDTCIGGSEGPNAVGEGPCNPNTGICKNAETQGPDGPQACPSDNAASGDLCEYADGFCFRQGARTIEVNGVTTTAWSDANQCFADRYQNGDLDFDGLSYQRSAWPASGNPNHPTAAEYVGPFQANGQPYPQVQYESDIGGSSFLCNTATGAGCTVPPISASFYPYWSLSGPQGFALGSYQTSCVWNFGGNLSNTIENFGGDAQYGHPDLSWYGGTSISPVLPNPQFSFNCAGPL
ncbi:MAG: hypothetical protein ACRDOL_01380 [Streptosporangiaceae bacterium]